MKELTPEGLQLILDWEVGGGQAYSGNSQIFVPLIHNAVNARATRFVNQLFPKGGRYVEVVSSDGEDVPRLSYHQPVL